MANLQDQLHPHRRIRSYTQQEVKWAWENMIDEMAEALGLDPIQFRLMHVSRPGTKLSPARDWDARDLGKRLEITDGAITYDSFASVEVLEEGAKASDGTSSNPVAGGHPGRFKKRYGGGYFTTSCRTDGLPRRRSWILRNGSAIPACGGGGGGEFMARNSKLARTATSS